MFFEKKEQVTIDGVTYVIPNKAMVEIWNCKEKLVEIFGVFDNDAIEMNLN